MAIYLTEQELCNAVYEAVLKAEKPLSRRDIAEAIAHKKAPRVTAMAEHLVSIGYFERCEGVTKFGKPVLLYFLAGTQPTGTPCEGYKN